jgi:hypothetical protein
MAFNHKTREFGRSDREICPENAKNTRKLLPKVPLGCFMVGFNPIK